MQPHDPPATPEPLSQQGQARRAEILDTLQRRLASRTRTRRALLYASTACAAILLSAAAYLATQPTRAPRAIAALPADIDALPEPSTSSLPAPPTAIRITMLAASPPTIAPCDDAAATNPPAVCLLSDDQLLAALAAAGENYGLIRAGGRTELVRTDRR